MTNQRGWPVVLAIVLTFMVVAGICSSMITAVIIKSDSAESSASATEPVIRIADMELGTCRFTDGVVWIRVGDVGQALWALPWARTFTESESGGLKICHEKPEEWRLFLPSPWERALEKYAAPPNYIKLGIVIEP